MTKITFGIATKITTKEREKYLYEAIESIINQSNNNWEIIISDDDSTIKIDYDKYFGNEKIRIFHQKVGLGIFKNFNFCLNKTNTEFFLPMGDDDLLQSNFVEIFLNELEKNKENNIDILCFNYFNIKSNGNIYQTSNVKEGFFLKGNKSLNISINDLFCNKNQRMLFCSIVKTNSLKKIGGYPDYGMVTDIYLIFLFSLNFNIKIIKNHLMKIRHHSTNASGIVNIDILQEQQLNLNKILIKDFKKNLSKKSINLIDNFTVKLLNNHISLLIVFKNKGRIEGIKSFFKFKKSIRNYVIFFLGILFGKKIHKIFIYLYNKINIFK